MIVGCYTLDVYCDCVNAEHEHREFPGVYVAERGSTCRRLARTDGWRLDLGRGLAVCPKCVRSGKTFREAAEAAQQEDKP